VHKAGEERRRGATPATATQPPSSWKARDRCVRAKRGRSGLGKKEKQPEGKAVTAKRVSAVGPEFKIHVCADERSVRRTRAIRGKTRARQLERSDVCRDKAKESTFTGGARLSPRSGRQARPEGREKVILEWSPFQARPSEARSRLETGRHGKRKAGGPRQSPRSACLPTG